MISAGVKINALGQLQMSGLTAMERFHATRPYLSGKDNKFGEIHDLNLVKACQSKIFALVLIAIY